MTIAEDPEGNETFILNKMVDGGWRCDVETYKNILNAIDGLSKMG